MDPYSPLSFPFFIFTSPCPSHSTSKANDLLIERPPFNRSTTTLSVIMKLTGILPLVAAVAAAMPSLATAANTTFSVLSNNVYFLSETLVLLCLYAFHTPFSPTRDMGKEYILIVLFFYVSTYCVFSIQTGVRVSVPII